MSLGPVIHPPTTSALSPDTSADWFDDVWEGDTADYLSMTRHTAYDTTFVDDFPDGAIDVSLAVESDGFMSVTQGLAWADVQDVLADFADWEPNLFDPVTGQPATGWEPVGDGAIVAASGEVTYGYTLGGSAVTEVDVLLRLVDPADWEFDTGRTLKWVGALSPGYGTAAGYDLLGTFAAADMYDGSGHFAEVPVDPAAIVDGIVAVTLSTADLEAGSPPFTLPDINGYQVISKEFNLRLTYQPPDYRLVFAGRTPLRARQRASGSTGAIPLRGRNNAPEGLRGRQNANA